MTRTVTVATVPMGRSARFIGGDVENFVEYRSLDRKSVTSFKIRQLSHNDIISNEVDLGRHTSEHAPYPFTCVPTKVRRPVTVFEPLDIWTTPRAES